MTDKTQAEKLAFTLRYLIDKGCIPGLLPKDVEAAAELLVKQEKALDEAREALAAKSHIVEATAKRENYRLRVRGTFVITDPRIYYGDIEVSDQTIFAAPEEYWTRHVARQLTLAATADWMDDINHRAFMAVRTAIATAARSDETLQAAQFVGRQSGHEVASPEMDSK